MKNRRRPAPPCPTLPHTTCLQMFASDPPYDKSVEQLAAFLGRLVGDEKLALDGGMYRRR